MMAKTNTDEQTFFRIAHVYWYGCDGDTITDVVQFKLHAICPWYVLRYAEILNEYKH
jgi:hypothetical protein